MKNKTLLFVLLIIIFNLLQSALMPITKDEAYYWLWSQNPDWGYFDHPPMTAFWVLIGSKYFSCELGVRLLTAIMNGLSFLLLLKTLNPKTDKETKLFWIIFLSVSVLHLYGFIATPDSPLLFFIALYLFGLKKFLRNSTIQNTLILAVSLAGLMYSKYHGILVIIFSMIPAVGYLIKNFKFYLAVIISLILYLPHLIWLFQNDFIPIQYHFIERVTDKVGDPTNLLAFLGIFFLGCSPLLSWHIFNSTFRTKFNDLFLKCIKSMTLLTGAFFFVSAFRDSVQFQWLSISFIGMAILTYEKYSKRDNFKSIYNLGLTTILIFFTLRILSVFPGISPVYKGKEFALKAGEITKENAVFEKYQEASIFKFYNREKGTAVHRTLGNRKSQFDLWKSEEKLHGKNVTYISPWVKSGQHLTKYEKYEYLYRDIPNYPVFTYTEIESDNEIIRSSHEKPVTQKIKITNNQNHELDLSKNSELNLVIIFYQKKQFEVIYSYNLTPDELIISPGESKTIKVSFQVPPEKGNYNASYAIYFEPLGSTYLSNPLKVISE